MARRLAVVCSWRHIRICGWKSEVGAPPNSSQSINHSSSFSNLSLGKMLGMKLSNYELWHGISMYIWLLNGVVEGVDGTCNSPTT